MIQAHTKKYKQVHCRNEKVQQINIKCISYFFLVLFSVPRFYLIWIWRRNFVCDKYSKNTYSCWLTDLLLQIIFFLNLIMVACALHLLFMYVFNWCWIWVWNMYAGLLFNDNIFVGIWCWFFWQVIGIPMRKNCSPLLVDRFLYSYRLESLRHLSKTGR